METEDPKSVKIKYNHNTISPGGSIDLLFDELALRGSIDSIFLKNMNESNDDDYIVITMVFKLPGGIEKYDKYIKLGDIYGFTGE